MEEVYVIMETTGEYEDRYSRPICAVLSEEDAKSHIKTLKEAIDERNKIAIKDVISEDDEDSYGFNRLLDEFKVDLIRKLFPRFNDMDVDEVYFEDELTQDEVDIYYELSEREELAKWMKEVKGYSDDVISATIEYNYLLSYDAVEPYYHYIKVPFKS